MFERGGEELVQSCETDEDEAEDTQIGRGSWVPILAPLSLVPAEVT